MKRNFGMGAYGMVMSVLCGILQPLETPSCSDGTSEVTTYSQVEDAPKDVDDSGDGDDNENYAYVSKEEDAAQEQTTHPRHD